MRFCTVVGFFKIIMYIVLFSLILSSTFLLFLRLIVKIKKNKLVIQQNINLFKKKKSFSFVTKRLIVKGS